MASCPAPWGERGQGCAVDPAGGVRQVGGVQECLDGRADPGQLVMPGRRTGAVCGHGSVVAVRGNKRVDLAGRRATRNPVADGTAVGAVCGRGSKQRICCHDSSGCASAAHQGHVRRRHHTQQSEQALCLTVVTNAVVLFNTVYLHHALDTLRQRGHDIDDQALQHLSPALHEHINPYGSYSFDVDRELSRTGLRPLRDPA